MSRGDQRERARERNAKKLAHEKQAKTGDPRKRNEHDAAALAAKVAAKQAAVATTADPTRPHLKS